ncbi:uncharacterized protein LOC142817630 [Rhipicephalus microplus]|uniref:uncharacterized protein LOC142817630 n=1 Tax=Rhipicephalus microplus TaxID=6941 RepID=UPI003F6BACAE
MILRNPFLLVIQRDATSKICCLEHVSARVWDRHQFFKPAHYYSVPGGASSTTISHVIDTNGYKKKRSAGTDQWARQRRREHDSQEPLLACYSGAASCSCHLRTGVPLYRDATSKICCLEHVSARVWDRHQFFKPAHYYSVPGGASSTTISPVIDTNGYKKKRSAGTDQWARQRRREHDSQEPLLACYSGAASCSCHLRTGVPLYRDATSKICCLEHVSARVWDRHQFFKPAHYYSVPGGASSTTISHVIDTNGYKKKRSAGTDQWARQRRREHDSQEPLLACYSGAASCSCHLRTGVPLYRDATSKICCLEHVSARVWDRHQFFKPAHYYSVPGGASSTTISHVIDTNGYKKKRSAGTDQWARQRRREHDSQEPLLACYSVSAILPRQASLRKCQWALSVGELEVFNTDAGETNAILQALCHKNGYGFVDGTCELMGMLKADGVHPTKRCSHVQCSCWLPFTRP